VIAWGECGVPEGTILGIRCEYLEPGCSNTNATDRQHEVRQHGRSHSLRRSRDRIPDYKFIMYYSANDIGSQFTGSLVH
jgi:hypothetical protein